MRDIELSANDRRHAFHRRMSQGVAKSVSTNHSRRTNNDETCLTGSRSLPLSPRDATRNVKRSGLSHLAHESARSSIQSTYSRRSAKSHEPSFFTKVSRYRSDASIKRPFPPSSVT